MAQTLCAHLQCDRALLEELSKTLSFACITPWVENTSYALPQQYRESGSLEIHDGWQAVVSQVRDQFSKVVEGLITSEDSGTTVVEEWPVALEFNGWATENCVEFCNSYGLVNDLRKCKKALGDIFSNIIKSTAEIDYYQEIGVNDKGHVVIRLEIKSDRKTYRKEYNTWVSWMVNNLSDVGISLITISIDRLWE